MRGTGPLRRLLAMGLCSAFLTAAASAASLKRVSPQGEVPDIRQFSASFDQPMVPFGSGADAPAPLALRCEGPGKLQGHGRWLDATSWVYDFDTELQAGVRCTATVTPGLRAQSGSPYAGPTAYRFTTGGPRVVQMRPYGGRIAEDQVFIARLNAVVPPASLLDNVFCEADGLGERLPIRLLDAATRRQLLSALKQPVDEARTVTFACQRPLPAKAKVRVRWEAGLSTASGLSAGKRRDFSYRVREPFAASFSCERENARADCTPLRPLALSFNAPISRRDAEAITLDTPQGARHAQIDDADSSSITAVRFAAPLPEHATLSLRLPTTLRDDAGRALANAGSFPMRIATAAMPPLLKFASGDFGVLERFAESDGPALLPLTVRRIEGAAPVRAQTIGAVSQKRIDADHDIVQWFARMQRIGDLGMRQSVDALERLAPGWLARSPGAVTSRDEQGQLYVDPRSLSLLAGEPGLTRLNLPAPAKGEALRPFEVIGVPLTQPGFYVVEAGSAPLGASLLARPATMYVHTTALVTNLGVHLKTAREGALVWVTTLDSARPVSGAKVRLSDCRGTELAQGLTGADGVLRLKGSFDASQWCDDTGLGGLFASARVQDPRTGPDMAFVFSSWNQGIEPWRFHVPTESDMTPTRLAHTVFDRTLFKPGETVSMKHFLRRATARGLNWPGNPPDRLRIEHLGSGQRYEQPLDWRADHTAISRFTLPPAAKLGDYAVSLAYSDKAAREPGLAESQQSGSFRVEQVSLPVMRGTVSLGGAPLVAPASAHIGVQLDYVSGGAAADLPVRVSAVLQAADPAFGSAYPDFDFSPYVPPVASSGASDDEDSPAEDAPGDTGGKLIADKRALTLNANGAGTLTLDKLPALHQPQRLVVEADYPDPNGEIGTLRGTAMVWPAGVAVGVRAPGSAVRGEALPIQALTLDLDGRAQGRVPVTVRALVRKTISHRRRLVGGFYAYDNRVDVRDLGTVCQGQSDAQGLFSCSAKLAEDGEITLVARAQDASGHVADASHSVWLSGSDESWFGGDDTDRIDILPERRDYAPGETARFQVRMPFREARALITVEREGVLSSQVMTLRGKDPSFTLRVGADWGPNVYVSALVLRPRLREVPWYSFFTWGWRQPLQWAHAFWHEGRAYRAPSALIDLSKPAFRLGLSEIRVGLAPYRLGVSVSADKPRYAVRQHARVRVKVSLPDGRPAPAGTRIAFAAVDEALLELQDNDSWHLLDAMYPPRALGVRTATAQMQVVGRRHYGRKAVPAGGGGGRSPTRELFDTLLLWNPDVVLDSKGEASVEVPLSDALTTFRLVALAALGDTRFGTGETRIRTTQDLQLISGLPALVREGDRYRAGFTVRNTTPRAMEVTVQARAAGLAASALAPQTVSLAANAAREVSWEVSAPQRANAAAAFEAPAALRWQVEASETGAAHAHDALRVEQALAAAVPLSVRQATLLRLGPDGASVPVAAPRDALARSAADATPRGGLRLSVRAHLADAQPGVARWLRDYPYSCLEQQVSRAIGLDDAAGFRRIVGALPTYLDGDGLASYFPPTDDSAAHGSDILTAYLLEVSAAAAQGDAALAWPDEARTRMLDGLERFVTGRLSRRSWAPREDRDWRRLAALAALSRYGRARPAMLDAVRIDPANWPTSTLIDWYRLTLRMQDMPQREARRAEAEQLLRARLTLSGTRLDLNGGARDDLWWLMSSDDTNAARLLELASEDPAWHDDVGRLALGLIGRQRNAAWSTTAANAWAMVALRRFSATQELTPVSGSTEASLGKQTRSLAWRDSAPPAPWVMDWPTPAAGPGTLAVRQQGSGQPWLSLEGMAAVPLRQPVAAGYRITREVERIEGGRAVPLQGALRRGDVLRVRLRVEAQTPMTWVVVDDPVPAGATLLGSGLGRDSQLGTQAPDTASDADAAQQTPSFVERARDAYRAYFDYLPKGSMTLTYSVRLNAVGHFALPPTRVSAMYAPGVYGETPNAAVDVTAAHR